MSNDLRYISSSTPSVIGSNDLVFNPATNTLFLSGTFSGGVQQIGSLISGTSQPFGQSISQFASIPASLTAIGAITATPTGTLLVADPSTGKIVEVAANGTPTSGGISLTLPADFIGTGSRGPVAAIAYNPGNAPSKTDDSIYVVTSTGDQVVEFDLTGKELAKIDLKSFGLTNPVGLARDPATGNLFVSTGSAGNNKIYEFTPPRRESIPTGIADPTQPNNIVAPAIANNLQLHLGKLLSIIDPTQGNVNDVQGMTIDPAKRTIYTVSGDGSVAAFAIATPTAAKLSLTGSVDLTGGKDLVYANGKIYAFQTGTSGPEIAEFNPDLTFTGTIISLAATGFTAPQGLSVKANGNLLVADAATGSVKEIDTTGALVNGGVSFTGAIPGFTAGGALSGIYYTDSDNIGTAASNSLFGKAAIYATDFLGKKIVEIDPTNGNVVQTYNLSTAIPLLPQGITYDSQSKTFFVAGDSASGNIIYEFTLTPNASGTGAVSLLGSTNTFQSAGINDPEGLSFDPTTKTLYASFNNDQLNPATFQSSLVPNGSKLAKFTVDNAPSITTIREYGKEATAIALAATNFTGVFKDSNKDSLASITVQSLPTEGTLTLSGAAVTQGQVITAAQLDNLSYTSNAGFSGVDHFTYTASDGTLSSAPNLVEFGISSVNATTFQVTNAQRFYSADGLIYNPVTKTVFAAESYRLDPTNPKSVQWKLKELDPTTLNVLRTVLVSEDFNTKFDPTSPTAGTTVGVADTLGTVPGVVGAETGQTDGPDIVLGQTPTLALLPGQTDTGIQELSVITGTGTARDGDILILGTRAKRVVEITPDGKKVGKQISADAIDFTSDLIFSPDLTQPVVVPVTGNINSGFNRSGVGLSYQYDPVTKTDNLLLADFATDSILKLPTNKSSITAADVISTLNLKDFLFEGAEVQDIEVDPKTGNYLIVEDVTNSFYEVTPQGKVLGITSLVSLGRQYGTQLGKTGADLDAFANKFKDSEGLGVDPVTGTVYLSIDDDAVGQFGLDAIGNQVVAIQLNHPPVLGEDAYEFTIEDAKNGDLVGDSITATDPDKDPVTYTLGEDDPNDPQQKGLNAFAIDSSTGQIKVQNAQYLLNQSVFNLTVTAKDVSGLSDTSTVKITVDPSDLIQPDPTNTPGIFSISSLSVKNLLVSIQNTVNLSVGLFLVDAPDGSIITGDTTYKPGDSGYSKEAIKRALSLLNALAGSKNFSPGQLKKILGLKDAASLVSPNHQGTFYFGFLSVSDGTLGGLLQGSGSATLSTDKSGITITPNSDGSYSISLGSSSFTLQLTSDAPASDESAGLHIQVGDIDEIITSVISDLTGKSGKFTVTATAFREAAFDNILGFFAVDNNGNVLKADGTLATDGTLANTDAYRKAIADNLLNPDQLIKIADGDKKTFSFSVNVNDVTNAGFHILPVLGVKVTTFSALASTIYYPILGINPSDKFDRMVAQGSDSNGLRVYGFEDLPSGGDKDFNDFTVQIKVSAA